MIILIVTIKLLTNLSGTHFVLQKFLLTNTPRRYVFCRVGDTMVVPKIEKMELVFSSEKNSNVEKRSNKIFSFFPAS
jgi:hypothetical protein